MEDELRSPPVDDTIAMLVRAARRAGFDVDPDVRDEAGSRRDEWRHVRAMVVACVAILLAAISIEGAVGARGAIVATILVLAGAALADIYRRTRT